MSKAVLPRRLALDVKGQQRAIKNALKAAAKAVKVDYDVTTQTFNDRPTFEIVPVSDFVIIVGTDDQIYGYLDDGTRPHIIVPHGKALVFPGGRYKAKTRVKVIGSRAGGSGGEKVFVRKPVHHPGTEARDFSEVIAEKWEKRLPEIMQRAIDAELR